MNKKYELTDETKIVNKATLHRIKALRDFADVKAGDLGGWIESEENLSHDGNALVYDDAKVFKNAKVSGNTNDMEILKNNILAELEEKKSELNFGNASENIIKNTVLNIAKVIIEQKFEEVERTDE